MTETEKLIGLLERATGPDRELDDLLAVRVAGMKATTTYGHECLGNVREAPNHSPRYTASLDAALALVERVKPGWKWERQWELGGEFIRLLAPDYHRWTFKGALNRSATGWQSCEPGDAIALCLALLYALETSHDQ